MVTDRERWDARYAGELSQPERPPDPFVFEVLRALGPGAGRTALDLACGTGRHALLSAELGWAANAWDVSPVGLAVLGARARERALAIETRAVDLTDGLPGSARFELVVVVDFLDRDLFQRLQQLLCPGGSLVVATFTDDWPEAHPSSRFRLRTRELARGLPGVETLRSAEGAGRAGLWARAREDS